MSEYRPLLAVSVANLFKEAVMAPLDRNYLSMKYAVYGAASLSAPDISDYVDFDEILSSTILSESQNYSAAENMMLRKRIAQLIGAWVDVKLSKIHRRTAFEILLSMLRDDEDLGVKIISAKNMKIFVDNWEFEPSYVGNSLDVCIDRIIKLVHEVEDLELKRTMLALLNSLIQRMPLEILPYKDFILELLPSLWSLTQEHGKESLQMSIIDILRAMVEVLRSQSVDLQDFVCPIIIFATDLAKPASVYLMEDGLLLFLSVVSNSSFLTPQLALMFSRLLDLLEISSENLRVVLQILESYCLFGSDDLYKVKDVIVLNAGVRPNYCSKVQSNVRQFDSTDYFFGDACD
jgi:hypothetical protein